MPKIVNGNANGHQGDDATANGNGTSSVEFSTRQLRLYQFMIAVLVSACFYHFSQDYFLLAIPSPEETQTLHSNHTGDIHATNTPVAETVHILYGLSGNHDGFFGEFEVCLKSVLMNAPHKAPMEVHIMADQQANDKLLQDVFPRIFKTRVSQSDNQTTTTTATGITWFTNVTITVYNVAKHLTRWNNYIDNRTHYVFNRKQNTHTVGAFFRLFAQEVIPFKEKDVDRVLYMDTDVVILANLATVYHQAPPSTHHWLIQMSWKCDGFALVHLPQMHHFWDLIDQINFRGRKSSGNDQDLVLAIQDVFDEKNKTKPLADWYIQNVSKPWDLYITRDWHHIKKDALHKFRPQVGAVHYNGGGGSKEAYYEGVGAEAWVNNENARQGWGLAASFYRDLPWSWAFYMGQSMSWPFVDSNTQIRLAAE